MSSVLLPADAISAGDAIARDEAPACLIVNPLSYNASRGLAVAASARARALGADVMEVRSPSDTEAALDAIFALRRRRVLVLAGDGTVQGVVSRLARAPAGTWVPELMILPGGRSNLTAVDFAPRGNALQLIERALDPSQSARWEASLQSRAVMCIEQSPAPPRYGFFVGAALVDDVIRRVHAHRAAGSGTLHDGPFSSHWSLFKTAMASLVGASGLHSTELVVDAGPIGRLAGEMRVLMASTLDHAGTVYDPYAVRGTGALRVTAASRRAAGFWRRMPRVLVGRFSSAMTPETGWLSGRCDRIEITGLAHYVLDGEPFDADPARPVVIGIGPRLRFAMP